MKKKNTLVSENMISGIKIILFFDFILTNVEKTSPETAASGSAACLAELTSLSYPSFRHESQLICV